MAAIAGLQLQRLLSKSSHFGRAVVSVARNKPSPTRCSHIFITSAENEMPTNAPAMTSLKKWKSPASKATAIATTLAAQSTLSAGKYVQRIAATAQTAAL